MIRKIIDSPNAIVLRACRPLIPDIGHLEQVPCHCFNTLLLCPLSSPTNASLVQHPIGLTAHYSDNEKPIVLTPHWSYTLISLSPILNQGHAS